MSGISVPAQLLRGFASNFITAHITEHAKVIMSPKYRLLISGHLFDGRDNSYLPATAAQLEQFPGLCVTVHDVVLTDDAAAMRFTEHGANAKDGVVSTWGGLAIFRISNGQFEHGWAEEDYYARKRQLKTAVTDDILQPHPSPWDCPVQPGNPDTEQVLREWLGNPAAVFRDIEEISAQGPRLAELIEPQSITISFLFSAGDRAAVHAVVDGQYLGGFSDVASEKAGSKVSLPIAAIVDTRNGKIGRVQLCGDRLGLNRSLLSPKP